MAIMPTGIFCQRCLLNITTLRVTNEGTISKKKSNSAKEECDTNSSRDDEQKVQF